MKRNIVIAIAILGITSWIATVGIQAHAENTGVKTSITNTIKWLFDKVKEKKTEVKEIKTEVKENKKEIKTNRKTFEEKFENITKYVRQNLTETERKSVKSIVESRIKAIETLNKQTRTQLSGGTQLNTWDFTAKVTEIYNGFKTSILPYIDSTKTEAFNTFITERIKLISTNRGLKTEIKKAIVEKKIEKKSEKELKAIAEEIKPLKELIKKIDEIIKNTKTQAIKDALSSAKKTLQAQLPTTGTIAK
jgi:hypothetical protein